ncbi:MAG: transcriptional regulator, LacI family [Actinomycetia bacterium]|jgi:LacI family transcriptional regulator|nr:transcriptional regulator, LacI family [Actinomycetes bacterium]
MGSVQRKTITDVARRASVSPATVSRVLNGDESVGAGYQRRVRRAVEELGYRPNRLAQNLRRQRSAAIGVVVSDIENPHFSEMVRAVEDQAYGRGYRVLVCNTDESPAKQATYLDTLVEERVLGVILSPSDAHDPQISALLDNGTPVVAFDREVDDRRADAVIADNLEGARTAVEVLVRSGHERITFVSGRRDVETGAKRLDGFEFAMRSHGLEARSVDGEFRTDGGHAAVAGLLASPDRPSALIVGNNLMTLGVLRAIREAGLRAPHDIALVAFDDPPWAEFVDPPLTTLAQPVRRMATEAMELLLERVTGARTEPRRTVHPFELRLRASSGSQ